MLVTVLATALLTATTTQPRVVRVVDLSSIRRVVNAFAASDSRPVAAPDIVALIDAVAGQPLGDGSALVTPALIARDALAYRLLAVGYSAHETADMIAGRISKAALDTATRMLMTGRGQE